MLGLNEGFGGFGGFWGFGGFFGLILGFFWEYKITCYIRVRGFRWGSGFRLAFVLDLVRLIFIFLFLGFTFFGVFGKFCGLVSFWKIEVM